MAPSLTLKAQHDGKGPSSTAERKEFIQTVLKEKKASDEENFDEAVTLFRRAGTRTGVSTTSSLHTVRVFTMSAYRSLTISRRCSKMRAVRT